MTSFDDLYNQLNNTSVEREDASALDQCYDLAFAWVDALSIPRSSIRHQYAYQIWANATDETRKYFDLIPNGPSNTPVKGDIVVFKQISGIPVGHVSIETGKSDSMNLITFDQNWDTIHYYHIVNGVRVPYCRTVVHSGYYGAIGWLHPKSTTSSDSAKLAQIWPLKDTPGTDADKVARIKTILST